VIDAVTKSPWAVKVGQMQAHATPWPRALSPQARAKLAGYARRHKVVVDQGLWAGTALWGRAQPGRCGVVPAQAHMAVTAEARAHAAAGEGLTRGCRVSTVRHGQGRAARPARLETAVVGLTGRTTEDPEGRPEPGRQHHRRDFQAHPINAVVVRTWEGKDAGPGGKTVLLPNDLVDQPWQPVDDAAARRLIEHGCLKATTQPWDRGHPPQKHARAVRVHVVCTLRMCALATAYRRPCAREDRGGDPVGWQRWRRQLLEQTRAQVMVCAQGYDGLVHLAESSRL
jgi:hypothetical protein